MLKHVAVGEKHLGPVMAVHDALIQDKLAVDIFFVDHLAVPIELISVPLGAEGDKRGERTEVIDVK